MSYGSIVHKFSTHCELTQITFERTFSDGFVSMRLLFVHLAPTLYGVPVKSGISSRFSSTPSMTDTCFPFHVGFRYQFNANPEQSCMRRIIVCQYKNGRMTPQRHPAVHHGHLTKYSVQVSEPQQPSPEVPPCSDRSIGVV